MAWLNLLEPISLFKAFGSNPPEGFDLLEGSCAPTFSAPFNLLTTVEDGVKAKLQRLPFYARWSRFLSIKTAFVGTTVSEYVPVPNNVPPEILVENLSQGIARRFSLSIIKDIPQHSPLLQAEDNAYADALIDACIAQNYIIVEGQALAYVPLDFDSIEAYLARLSSARRKNLRRKLKYRDDMVVIRVPAGDNYYHSEESVDEYYALYDAVYTQSEIHFDRLTRSFLCTLLRDSESGGVIFEYRRQHDNLLIGWNLCYECNGNLVDKYIGLRYPHARDANLYFLSWIVNLEYALKRGSRYYIAGWTDPEVKASLGAQFTFTRHAVYIRNPLLRTLAHRFSEKFEGDRSKLKAKNEK